MSPIDRREWLGLMGAAGAGALLPRQALAATASPADPIQPLTSTSGVYTPARGNAFMKFSFDFPEPSVAFGGFAFGFLVFTAENTYGLDASRMRVEASDGQCVIECDRLVWAGGQMTAPGRVRAVIRSAGPHVEWDVTAQMDQPIRTVTTVVRGVPRGEVSLGGGRFRDRKDDELPAGYPFNAGDLNGPGESITTPIMMVKTPADVVFLSTLDDKVRPKRFYLAPGDAGYRVEAVYEHDAWRNDHRVTVPTWRLGRVASYDEAMALHLAHLEQAFGLTHWDDRTDAPAWLRSIRLATTLHGMHYTGYVFNDFARMREILRWMNTKIPGKDVLVFLPAWDGRYYWDYPNYEVSARMGGEAGFRKLIDEAQGMGFHLMPMFGANAANRHQPVWPSIAAGITRKIDGNDYNLDWVDWKNDRHQDGWLGYMNLGADAWREFLAARISEVIDRYGVDAYFLDIVGGHVNSTTGDMHEGTRRLVMDLRQKYPDVACVGEMPYDALHGFIPMFQVGLGPIWSRYGRNFQHLSSPAPGRGSSGVHEWGFSPFNEETLSLAPGAIPTLQVVDDTFDRHRDVMGRIIERARSSR